MLKFNWFGQACFSISNDLIIVTDPHDGKGVGLNPPQVENADIVTISHEHFDHADGLPFVKTDDTEVVTSTGEKEVKGVKIKGTPTHHDKAKGAERGDNTVYKLEADGKKIVHLGDLGHILHEEQIEKIKPVDILLIPVGGKFTIDAIEAVKITLDLEPQVVIPMHYKVEGLKVPIDDASQFLKAMKENGYQLEEKEYLELEKLPEEKKVVKLDCKS